MRTMILAWAMWCATLPLLADETPDDPPPVAGVRELDLSELSRPQAEGRAHAPTVITTAEELTQAFPEEDVQAALRKQVDFEREQLLFFAWSGSGQDQLTFQLGEGAAGQEVIFHYHPGRTRDYRPHFHLFAIPKSATWKVDNVGRDP